PSAALQQRGRRPHALSQVWPGHLNRELVRRSELPVDEAASTCRPSEVLQVTASGYRANASMPPQKYAVYAVGTFAPQGNANTNFSFENTKLYK
ncbi:MAG: hypothetical protein EBS86_11160, partial [Crocinitomicaceae bacterium]|nr:hypothetical protein [Crocinitomicaceae bacterium]